MTFHAIDIKANRLSLILEKVCKTNLLVDATKGAADDSHFSFDVTKLMSHLVGHSMMSQLSAAVSSQVFRLVGSSLMCTWRTLLHCALGGLPPATGGASLHCRLHSTTSSGQRRPVDDPLRPAPTMIFDSNKFTNTQIDIYSKAETQIHNDNDD